MKLLTLSDSDSYLKWAVGLAATAPAAWGVRHLALDNVIAPSPGQTRAVSHDYPGRPIRRVRAARLARTVRLLAPDVILLAATGPALEAVIDLLTWGGVLGAERPGLATGLPGISFPANELAVHHRRACDVLVLHSHRERAAYAEVTRRTGGPDLALAALPFLATARPADPGGRDVVFAAQALVPPEAEQRRAVLEALASLPAALTPVIKVRALVGERQAHNEALPYDRVWSGLPATVRTRDVEFRDGSMAAALRHAAGFATVSSTAALEALAAGVPTLVLDEFGVSDELINSVFVGSGLLGGLDRLTAADFASPRPDWLAENYFHAPADNDWVERFARLAELRRTRSLPAPPLTRDRWPIRARRQVRVRPPRWVWDAVGRLRDFRSVSR